MVSQAEAIPESLENEVGESISSRNSVLNTFKELGPPDLVHLTKSVPKANKENGTYHFVTGVDTSSSASIAAYLNTLTFSLGENQLWFGKHSLWKIHSGIYCSYNAFSRIDVRVFVQIPGSVESYVIDEYGDKRSANDEDIWQEVYLSAMLRALLFTDSDTFFVNCCRRLNPLNSKGNATRFFEACEKLFLLGPRLGAVSEIQVPNITNNYLVDGFLKFIQITGMYEEGLKVLENVAENEPEVVTLISKVLFLQNEEIKAVERMNKGILSNPRDAFLLELQSKFCQDKNRLDLALDCAIRAVNSAPSEFVTWARLVEVYIHKADYEQALLTLNSCPMFTYHEIDAHRMPPPAKSHFPLPITGIIDEIWSVDINSDNEVSDPSLLRLTAPTLRATFAKAYDLLTQIVARIGWDKLLKYRSNVFVMELEYRKEKNDKKGEENEEGEGEQAEGEGEGEKVEGQGEGQEGQLNGVSPEKSVEQNGNGTNTNNLSDHSANGGLEKPPVATTTNTSVNSKESGEVVADSKPATPIELRNKRLCERWLDHLFMVLYDDLRAYTVWRTELVHYESQQLPYFKSALEWEIYGMVAHRLKHQDEAIDAFQRSLEVKFSDRVLWKLLDYYVPESKALPVDTAGTLDAIVNLTAWNHRWYTEFSPKLLIALEKIITSEGLVKVRSKIDAKYSPQGIVELLDSTLNIINRFELPGTEY